MTLIANAYKSALLADATYALTTDGLQNKTATDLADLIQERMTPTLAKYIGDNFTLVSHRETVDFLESGFDGTVWRENSSGKLFISMQGTAGLGDFVADRNLAFTGNSGAQLADMVNWWLAISTPVGSQAPQIMSIGPVFVPSLSVAGLGLVSASELSAGVEVNGHSLGGYLATAFTRLLGNQAHVQHTATFNSAGFAIGSDVAFALLATLIGPSYGLGRYPTALEQTNYFARNGINFTTNNLWFGQAGARTELFNELSSTLVYQNHFMYKLTDALALGTALEKLDSTLTLATLNTIFEAGSNQLDASLERVLDVIRQYMFGRTVQWAPIGDVDASAQSRQAYHTIVSLLPTSPTFQSLAGKVVLGVSNGNFATQAKAHVGFEDVLALLTLSPFTMAPVGAGGRAALDAVMQSSWQADYLAWEADKAALQSGGAATAFTNNWIDDRAFLLRNVLQSNTLDTTTTVTDSTVPTDRLVEFRYFDDRSQQVISLTSWNSADNGANNALTTRPRQVVAFGSEGPDAITGNAIATLGDHLYGGGGNDTISGLDGADYLEGNVGSDDLKGGKGNDTLLGGSESDSLDGGADSDLLKGGDGSDTYTIDARDGAYTDTIVDSDGVGQINVVNAAGVTFALSGGIKKGTLWMSSDNQFVYSLADQGDGSFTLTIVGAGTQVLIKNWTPTKNVGITLNGAPAPQNPTTTVLIEGDRNPQTGAPLPDNADNLAGTAGSDHILGYGGGDLINASFPDGGNDWIQGGAGDDLITGGGGADLLEGASGRDVLNALGGNDEIWGGDRLSFDAINDQTLAGPSSQSDLINSSSGDDTAFGGASADYIFGGSGKDALVGGAGEDNIFGDRGISGIHFDWQIQRVANPDGSYALTLTNITQGTAIGLDPQADIIFGGAGNDLVMGDAGDDYIDGGADNDVIWGNAGADFIVAGEGADTVYGDGGTAFPTALDYTPVAQHGNDVIYGGAGNDSVTGGGGDDYVDGGAGNDSIFGGDGNDYADGGADQDQIIAGGGDDFLLGGAGNDVLRGDSFGLDVALLGNDYLDGGDGDDQMVGDGKDDSMLGGAGNDYMLGDDTNATLPISSHGNDTMDGGAGNDTLIGNAKDDQLLGGEGNDALYGDYGTDPANYGDDYLNGGDGNDYLQGFGGKDVLVGSAGNDTLFGEAGDDTLEGGAGFDALIGGAGNDTYVFNAGDTSPTPGSADFVDDVDGVNTIRMNGMSLEGLDLLATTDSDIHLAQNGQDSIYIRGLRSGAIGTVEVSGVAYTAAEFFGKTSTTVVNQIISASGGQLQGGKLGDTLNATGGTSIVAGGAGNDALSGSGGKNTYRYSLGDGVDTITDTSSLTDSNGQPQTSTVEFGTGVTLQDLTLSYASNALVIGFKSDAVGSVRLTGFDPANAAQPSTIDQFKFVDGTILTRAELLARGFDLNGTAAHDALTGTNLDDRLNGGAGNDTLVGGAGNDTYIFNFGDGSDVLTDSAGTDSIVFGNGITPDSVRVGDLSTTGVLTYGYSDQVAITGTVEQYQFSDGSVWTIGELRALHELALARTGDAQFITLELSVESVRFPSDISPADITVVADGSDLVFTHTNGLDQWRLLGWNDDPAYAAFFTAYFADGTSWGPSFLTSGDHAPTVAHPLLPQQIAEDAPWSLTVPADTFADIDEGDVLAYGATLGSGEALPSWLNFNPATRTFSGTPVNADVGSLQIKVTATDTFGVRANSAFTLTIANVNDAPTAAAAAVDRSAGEGRPFNAQLPANLFADIDASDALTLSVNLAGGQVLPSWLTFDPSTRTLSGTPGLGDAGTLNLRVTATDNAGATASQVFNLNVTHAPTVAIPISDQAATEDQAWSFTVASNSFVDLDVGDALVYSAQLTDGAALPDWLAFDVQTRTFSGVPSNAQTGNLALKVIATDSQGLSIGDEFTLTVANVNDAPVVAVPIGDLAATEDQSASFTFPAGTFTDVDAGDTLTYVATLADGSPLPSWITFNTASRTFTGTPLNGDVGVLGIKITATDSAGAVASSSFNLNVVNTNDAPSVTQAVPDQGATEDQAWSLVVPANTFADVDLGDTLGYAVTLIDGGALPTWLSFNAATRTFTGTPTNSEVGTTSVKIVATDSFGASVSSPFSVTVANTNDAPTPVGTLAGWNASAGSAATYTFATTAFADIDLVDTRTYSATLSNGAALPSWLTFNAATRTFSGTPGVNDGGDFSLKVVLTDSGGATAYQTLTLHVETSVTLVGTSGNDSLVGGAGNDFLDGLAGTDTLRGGAGDDTYTVDATGDVITENVNEGYDTVYSSATYTLPANVEKLVLTGTNNRNGTGNALNNVLTGNSGANSLTGGSGNDTLDGAGASDTLTGGAGDDVYIVYGPAAGSVIEQAGEGTDTVMSPGNFNLPNNVENVVVTGSSGASVNGNSLNNVLTGNNGTDVLKGAGGNDTLYGGAGNDNLQGESGDDAMYGGQGDDLYEVAEAGDTVSEFASEGIDTVSTRISFTLGANVENLVMDAAGLTGTGNALNNVLTGSGNADTLQGAAGNDTLDGGGGADQLMGGAGDDVYVVNLATDVVVENAADGVDTVQASVAYTLAANLENLTIVSGSSGINGVGNAQSNVLIGNGENNHLDGLAGNDTLDGGAGSDQLTGGAGNDTYRLARGYTNDKIVEDDGTVGNGDVAQFASDISAAQLWFKQNGSNLEVIVIGTSDKFVVQNWFSGSQYHVEQFVSGDGKVLLDGQVQNLVNAMSSFNPPTQTTLPADYQAALIGVIEANWQ